MRNKRLAIYLSLLLLAAIAGGWLITQDYPGRITIQPTQVNVRDNAPASRNFHASGPNDNITVSIYYLPGGTSEGAAAAGAANNPDDDLLQDQVQIAFNILPVKLAEEIIPEYIRRLPGGLKDTKLLGVYRDRDNILYVDLSDEFRKGFAGDARREYDLLKSLYKTLTAGIPGITDVKLLLEDREVDSIGGHFLTLYPLGGFLATQKPTAPVPTAAPDRQP